jgi:glutathione S-transferase
MTPIITAFAASPDRGRGMARDMRVRWALEEVGQPCDVRLLSFAEMKEAAHLARQPFGQIPTYEDGEVTLFETGAIVLHVAERFGGLLPEAPAARGRAVSWMFAAVSSVEAVLLELETARFFDAGEVWAEARMPFVQGRVERRLSQLSAHLGDRDWLEGSFTAGDLMMVGVLFRFQGALVGFPNLVDYVARGAARPAFQRAFAAQRAVFEALQDRGA